MDASDSVCGACTFRTGTVRNGQPLVVGVLVRVDGAKSHGMYRVTVRSTHATVSAAIRNVVENQLGPAP